MAVSMRETPRIPAFRPSSTALDIIRRARDNRPLTHDWSFTQPATVSLDAPSRPVHEYAPSSRSSSPEEPQQARETSQTQNTWGPIDTRPRNAISGTGYVERRLREAVGQEVNRLSSRLYTQTGGSAVEEDRQVMREAERMIEQVRQDLRRVVDARMESIIRPGWSGNTGTPAVAESNSHEQWHPVRPVRTDLFIPPNGPGTATVVSRDIPGSYSRLRRKYRQPPLLSVSNADSMYHSFSSLHRASRSEHRATVNHGIVNSCTSPC